MRHGPRLILFFGGEQRESDVPAAPVASFTSSPGDNPPSFNVDLADPQVGDVITLQIADNPSFTSPVEETNTIDSGEAAAHAVTFDALAALGDGTWYFRFRHTHDGNVSDWSDTLSDTIGAVGPASDGLLLETGDFLLLESGDFLLLE